MDQFHCSVAWDCKSTHEQDQNPCRTFSGTEKTFNLSWISDANWKLGSVLKSSISGPLPQHRRFRSGESTRLLSNGYSRLRAGLLPEAVGRARGSDSNALSGASSETPKRRQFVRVPFPEGQPRAARAGPLQRGSSASWTRSKEICPENVSLDLRDADAAGGIAAPGGTSTALCAPPPCSAG